PYYQMGRQAGAEIARLGFNVITGGGPGVMEAANRGAKDVGGHSIGCNIMLPREQAPNPYIDRLISFRYFFVRKVMLVKYSQAFVILPGGYGTLDEAFEAATLIQTRKILDFPLVFMGVNYWQPLFDFLRRDMLSAGTIDRDDFDRLVLTDSLDELRSALMQCPFKVFEGQPLPKRRWWLGE
ncbi:MAG: TIGR00730 family Rossman fold protein, partial [Planctomycetaceae bacterium]